MTERNAVLHGIPELFASLSPAARAEVEALDLIGGNSDAGFKVAGLDPVPDRPLVPKRAISAPGCLNEAHAYSTPSSFSRGMRVELPGATMLYLSGTASIDDGGWTVYKGDFAAQLLRTLRNLTGLLAAEDASWHDVVRTSCYLRDIDRDYDTFNEIRTAFMNSLGLDPLPASTGIQAGICRSDLLVEIEAIAIIPNR